MKPGNLMAICLMSSLLVACGGGSGASLNSITNNTDTNTDTGTNTGTDTGSGTGSGASTDSGNDVSNPPGNTDDDSDTDENTGSDTADSSLRELAYNVIDAAYSDSMERLITVSSAPDNALNIINPATGEQQSILLNYAPTSLAISPTGDSAVVGHNGAVTYINLQTASLIGFYDITGFKVFDLALDGKGIAYASPTENVQWGTLKTINLTTGALQDSPYAYLRGGAYLQIADAMNGLYTLDTGLPPVDIEKFDTTSNPPVHLYESPYNGDFDMGDYANYGMWLTEDEKYLLTAGETLFQLSSSQDEDMLYVRSVSDDDGDYTTTLMHADHSQEAGKLVVIQDNSAADANNPYKLKVYTMPTLALDEELSVSALDPASSGSAVTPQFVFFNSDGSKLYSILQQDSGTYLKTF